MRKLSKTPSAAADRGDARIVRRFLPHAAEEPAAEQLHTRLSGG